MQTKVKDKKTRDQEEAQRLRLPCAQCPRFNGVSRNENEDVDFVSCAQHNKRIDVFAAKACSCKSTG